MSKIARPIWRVSRWALALIVAVLVLPYLLAPLYRFGRPVSTLMLWRWTTGARVERIWVPLEATGPFVARAVIAAEDARFCSHRGVDWQEIREAVEDAEDGGRLRGGSTITQQTAKNLFLWQGRSLVRKALEFPLALTGHGDVHDVLAAADDDEFLEARGDGGRVERGVGLVALDLLERARLVESGGLVL